MQSSELTLKLEGSALELSNFILKWNKLHTSGMGLMNSIVTLKSGSLKGKEASYEEMYPEGLQEKCNCLEAVIVELDSAVNDLQLLVQQIDALSQLDKIQNGSYSAPFNSISTDQFKAAFQSIFDTYSKELALKKFIKQEVSHCLTRDMLLMHVAAWDHQPFVSNICLQLCRRVLVETGVAPLSTLSQL